MIYLSIYLSKKSSISVTFVLLQQYLMLQHSDFNLATLSFTQAAPLKKQSNWRHKRSWRRSKPVAPSAGRYYQHRPRNTPIPLWPISGVFLGTLTVLTHALDCHIAPEECELLWPWRAPNRALYRLRPPPQEHSYLALTIFRGVLGCSRSMSTHALDCYRVPEDSKLLWPWCAPNRAL